MNGYGKIVLEDQVKIDGMWMHVWPAPFLGSEWRFQGRIREGEMEVSAEPMKVDLWSGDHLLITGYAYVDIRGSSQTPYGRGMEVSGDLHFTGPITYETFMDQDAK